LVSIAQAHNSGTRSALGGDRTAEQWLSVFDISQKDLGRVRAFGAIVLPRMADYIQGFYEWMRRLPEYEHYFTDVATLARAQSAQSEGWRTFFRAEVDEHFIEDRRRIGRTHARIGLPSQTYLAGMSYSFNLWTERLYSGGLEPVEFSAACVSVGKLLHLESTVVMETYVQRTNEVIANQSRALLEMSTPVAAVWDQILLLPVVGIIDSKRAGDIMNRMLEQIGATQARAFILDISGVAVVDTAVANHLIKMTKATRLMGCDCIISGLSPAVAQTIVELGIEVGEIRTTSTLKDALKTAFSLTGVAIQRA
jgi:rsbT co-antagonist protein RsbR